MGGAGVVCRARAPLRRCRRPRGRRCPVTRLHCRGRGDATRAVTGCARARVRARARARVWARARARARVKGDGSAVPATLAFRSDRLPNRRCRAGEARWSPVTSTPGESTWVEVSSDAAVVSSYLDSRGADLGGGIQRRRGGHQLPRLQGSRPGWRYPATSRWSPVTSTPTSAPEERRPHEVEATDDRQGVTSYLDSRGADLGGGIQLLRGGLQLPRPQGAHRGGGIQRCRGGLRLPRLQEAHRGGGIQRPPGGLQLPRHRRVRPRRDLRTRWRRPTTVRASPVTSTPGEPTWVEVFSYFAVVSRYLDSRGPTWVEVSSDAAVVTSYLDPRGPTWVEVCSDLAVVSRCLDSRGPTWVEVSSDAAVVSSYLDSRGPTEVEVSSDPAVVTSYLDSRGPTGVEVSSDRPARPRMPRPGKPPTPFGDADGDGHVRHAEQVPMTSSVWTTSVKP
ncbi:hypothetical protein BN12_2520007 [Nostocoides japonicum T1-X7]|uniref:Uncharacterized protein n=1 Tax=Nostocoides japonicum T1-X7 TaxID=1194083 RepID=A0A077M1M8_9MICO|nr:hypothetical protein BN12_2520007 [Tetrasphaera japonica T1-X7]